MGKYFANLFFDCWIGLLLSILVIETVGSALEKSSTLIIFLAVTAMISLFRHDVDAD